MKVNFAFLCDYALISAGQKLSLMGIFRRIVVPSLPATHPRAYLAFEIELDYTEIGAAFDIRVECVDADGNPLLRADAKLASEGKAKPADRILLPQLLELPPLGFTRAGKYDINVFIGPEVGRKALVEFDVVVAGPPPVPPIQGNPPLPLPGESA